MLRTGVGSTPDRRLKIAALAVLLATVFALAGARPAAAGSVIWERFDVAIQLREDGSLLVTERQEIAFDGGPFRGAFAALPLERTDRIENVVVAEEVNGRLVPYEQLRSTGYDEEPGTYTTIERADEIEVNWGFSEAVDETRVFVITYEVFGAVRVYEDEDGRWEQLWWTAVSRDVTSIAPVLQSTVTLTLPRPADRERVQLGEDADDAPAEHTSDFQTWEWSETNLRAGEEFAIRIEFPAMTSATPPAWQQADDERRFREEQEADRQALRDVFSIGAGLLIAVVGGIGLFALWYSRGRDPHVGPVASFLAEPPDDLPPGAVGALLDEVAHEHDIVATMVDLGRRGVITIEEANEGFGRDFKVTLMQPDAALLGFEQTLLAALFGPDRKQGQTTLLSRANPLFDPHAGRIRGQIYDELVARGYFTSSPERTRARWRAGARALLIALAFAGCFGLAFLVAISAFAIIPLLALALLATALWIVSPHLPRKTLAGAEAAAKWEAFRTYLADIEKYGRLSESREMFEKYLPYAVAFGLERSWVSKFAGVGAQAPVWYGPVIVPRPQTWTTPRTYGPSTGRGGELWTFPTGGGSWGDRSGSGGGFEFPDLQSSSDRAGRSLQGTSDSFFDMLNSAARAFGSYSGSGGGRHWGSTGGRRSGGGFRGGGRRGGSSGGGRRGFR